MLNVLLSDYEKGIELVFEKINKYINSNTKIVVLPWTFPVEIDSNILINEFFLKDGKRYKKYINPLIKMGAKKDNVFVLDCYNDDINYLKKMINNADVLVMPGGNPEMLFNKVVQDPEILYEIKHFKGIVIGASAGAELQLKRYFITAKNNYYKIFSFYDGFDIINNPFYFDVHSIDDKEYLDKLQSVANEKEKSVYAIFDDGAIIYNRDNKKIEIFGNVREFKPMEQ